MIQETEKLGSRVYLLGNNQKQQFIKFMILNAI